MAISDNFWKYVQPEPNSGCWLWSGQGGAAGYGRCASGKGAKYALAHRVSWELHFGPIPDGFCVCHKCDVRWCVNPDHLFLGTHAENAADMIRKGRSLTGERHHNSKLTPAAVQDILASGDNGPTLAQKYGVSKGAIYHVRQNLSWQSEARP